MDLLTVRTFLSLEEQEYLETLALSSKMRDAAVCPLLYKEAPYVTAFLAKGAPLLLCHGQADFCPRGVHEDAMENWPWGTPDYIFVQKHPPTTGSFILDVIAGIPQPEAFREIRPMKGFIGTARATIS
jgi:hypothetical protein